MEYKSFKCPECGANIDNINASFCNSCGVKLQFDDGSKNINYNYRTEDVAKIKEIEANKEIELNKMKENSKSEKKFVIGFLVFFLGMLAIMIISFTISENQNKLQEQELQSIVDEIYVDINSGNYEAALIKVRSLHYTGGYPTSTIEKWDDTRESIIKLIEEKMKNKK